jgi:cell shape-determining protein MreD
VLSFLAGIFAVVIVEGKNLNIGTDTLEQVLLVYYELFPVLILPLCIACLFFIQQVFHYRKIA